MRTLELKGVEYVVIEKAEYDRLTTHSGNAKSCEKHVDAISYTRQLLASRLKAALAKAGWSQTDLAAKAKVRPETISRIMSRKHTVDVSTWDKIERALRKAGIAA